MNSSFKHRVARVPIVGPTALLFARTRMALGYYRQPMKSMVKWLFRSRETTNFTYDLTPANKLYLASFVSLATGRRVEEAMRYIKEVDSDEALRAHVRKVTVSRADRVSVDAEARFGRRIGWYAIVRALKPRLVVETGVDKGLGACVLCAALLRNRAEGHEGRYLGTDINPAAGYLLTSLYSECGRVLIGDSIASLKTIDQPIDVFINDSDHSADYEAREYEVIGDKMSESGRIIGDNAHTTIKLAEFAHKTGRRFVYFHEEPLDHWYPGGGIGIAFAEKAGQNTNPRS